jgi:hypothetical protein
MDERVESAFKNYVIGDTLGSLFEGMSRGHIQSHFKLMSDYPDSTPALKNKMDQWKKPGLYGSLSQMGIIYAGFNSQNVCDISGFSDFIRGKGKILEGDSGVYRHPTRALAQMLQKSFENSETQSVGESGSCIPLLVFSLLAPSMTMSLSPVDVMLYARRCGAGLLSSVGCALALELLKAGAYTEDSDPILFANNCAEELHNYCNKHQPDFFQAGFNPDKVMECSAMYLDVFSGLSGKSIDECERIIIDSANKSIKHIISRASIDHPLTILPFACAIVSGTENKGDCLYIAAKAGGCSGALSAMAGLVSGAFYGTEISSVLEEGLINRKSTYDILHKIAAGTVSRNDISAFFDGEISLTRKEAEERRAKCGNIPENEKGNVDITGRQKILSRHVVESWTKLDRAKYNREKRHNTDNKDFEEYNNEE